MKQETSAVHGQRPPLTHDIKRLSLKAERDGRGWHLRCPKSSTMSYGRGVCRVSLSVATCAGVEKYVSGFSLRQVNYVVNMDL